jgi:predicted dehydrogenase
LPICASHRDESPPPARKRTLRAGVIGLGVGEAHARAYTGHDACALAAMCDFDAIRLAQVGEAFPKTRRCSRAEELLDDADIDIVSIASYDSHHHEQIVRAIRHGKHVFVEKPLCLNRAEAEDIRDALRDHPGVRLGSNLILRCSPRFIWLREAIAGGELGELSLLDGDYHYGRLHKITDGWRGAIEFYSVVYGGAIHLVDLLMWFAGERVVEVAAFGNGIASRGTRFRYNDAVLSMLRFESGIVAKVGVSYGCVRPHFHGVTVNGTRATFVNDVPDARLYRSRDPAVDPERISAAYPGVDKGALLESFIDSIVDGSDPIVTERDVFDTMSVCLAIEKASQTGRVEPVEYL